MKSCHNKDIDGLDYSRNMSRHQNSNEVKQTHSLKMGHELGSLYNALWNELAWAHMKWSEYVELFGTKESRIEILNSAAGRFFRIVQRSLWEDSLLQITRLTDPPKSAGKKNLTIRRLPDFIDDASLKGHVSMLIDTAVDNAEFCRDWRNRRIAHNDFDLALNSEAKPLQEASREKVKTTLDSISAVLNAVSNHYVGSTTVFDRGIVGSGGAVSLIYVLDDGIRAEKERLQRAKTGEYLNEDHQIRNL